MKLLSHPPRPVIVLAAALVGFTALADQAPAKKLSRLQGSAYIDRNRSIIGAAVVVRRQSDPSRVFLTSTDGRGSFHIDGLEDGTYLVSLNRDGFVPVEKDNIDLRFPFCAGVEVAMQRAGDATPGAAPETGPAADTAVNVRGRVIARSGDPVDEARLRLVHPSGRVDPRAVRTNPEGEFAILDVVADHWRLEARGVGFLPLRVPLDLRQDTELELFLVPQPTNYEPSPLELMPPEQLIPPPAFKNPASTS